MSIPAPVECLSLPECCAVPTSPFYGQGQTFLNDQTGFLLTCPPGFSCDAGAYPHPIIVPKGSVPFTPPTGQNPLRATCCDGVELARYLPDGFSIAVFNAAAQSLVNEMATHLTGCMAAQYNAANATPAKKCSITTASPLPEGTVGTPYSATLAVTGLDDPVTWSLLSGALPPGLSLSSAGVIAGTPTGAPASYGFVIRAKHDSTACTKLFTLTINGCDVTDWCTGPGFSACRLRVKDFNLADWTQPCAAGFLDTWDGTFSVAFSIFGNPCTAYAISVAASSPPRAMIAWDGSNWNISLILPPPAGFVYFAAGPATQASPIGTYVTGGGPACTGPGGIDIESYTP